LSFLDNFALLLAFAAIVAAITGMSKSIAAANSAVLVGLLACLVAGCSAVQTESRAGSAAGIHVEGIIIQNGLYYPVTDVMVEVPATGAFAGCGNIIQRSECRTSFPARDYGGSAVVVSWKEHGSAHQTDPFVVKLPETAVPGDVFWLEVVVFSAGQAGARLVQP
jgi:uncharacterized protein YceK